MSVVSFECYEFVDISHDSMARKHLNFKRRPAAHRQFGEIDCASMERRGSALHGPTQIVSVGKRRTQLLGSMQSMHIVTQTAHISVKGD